MKILLIIQKICIIGAFLTSLTTLSLLIVFSCKNDTSINTSIEKNEGVKNDTIK